MVCRPVVRLLFRLMVWLVVWLMVRLVFRLVDIAGSLSCECGGALGHDEDGRISRVLHPTLDVFAADLDYEIVVFRPSPRPTVMKMSPSAVICSSVSRSMR